jgi:hypothetical protein
MSREHVTKNPLEQEGRKITPYSGIIRDKIEPLRSYVKGKEDAKLQLEIGGNYLKIMERVEKKGKEAYNSDTIELSGSKTSFLKAYSFVSLLNALYEAGDNLKSAVSRTDAKIAISSTLVKEFNIWENDRGLNSALKNLIEKYDVFGKHKRKTRKMFDAVKGQADVSVFEKNLDHISLGYTLKGNTRILIVDKFI